MVSAFCSVLADHVPRQRHLSMLPAFLNRKLEKVCCLRVGEAKRPTSTDGIPCPETSKDVLVCTLRAGSPATTKTGRAIKVLARLKHRSVKKRECTFPRRSRATFAALFSNVTSRFRHKQSLWAGLQTFAAAADARLMARPRIQAISDTTRAGVDRDGLTLTAKPWWSDTCPFRDRSLSRLVCDDRVGRVSLTRCRPTGTHGAPQHGRDGRAKRVNTYHRTGGTYLYVPTLRRFLGSREYQGLRRRFVGKRHYGTASFRAEGNVSALGRGAGVDDRRDCVDNSAVGR